MDNTVQNVIQAKGKVINTSSHKRKRMKGNKIVEEGNVLKVYPNVANNNISFIFDLEDRELLQSIDIKRGMQLLMTKKVVKRFGYTELLWIC